MTDEYEMNKEKIVEECIKRGAKERNVTSQYHRFLKYPVKVAHVIVETREDYEEDWQKNTVPPYLIIESTRENYIRYMYDNTILLDVMCDIVPESPLLEEWKQAKKIIEDDLVKNDKKYVKRG